MMHPSAARHAHEGSLLDYHAVAAPAPGHAGKVSEYNPFGANSRRTVGTGCKRSLALSRFFALALI